MQSVNFKNRGLVIAANLYFPPAFDAKKTFPAIISAHPVGGVKEQTARIYIEKIDGLRCISIC